MLKRRFTPAMIVAMIALLVALSGTAVAGTAKLITSSAQIKNGTIKLADIDSRAQTTLKGQTGPKGAAGEKGEKGDTGATGPQGPQGERGPAGIVDAVKARVCVDTSTGSMTFVPGAGPSGSCGLGKQMINIYIEG
jgi:Collagen triple helix repeat (20 copies)